MRSKNEVLCAAAGRLAAERSEIITSRTPSAEIITLSAARQLVRCHDNEVTL
jgi:hypothetical protein